MTSAVLLLELLRKTTHVHARVQHDLSQAGVSGISPSLFDVAPAAVPIWLLWLFALSGCFLVISSHTRRQLGRTLAATLRVGTLTWVAGFGLTWLSFLAFGPATVETAAIGLAGAWVESQLVAAVAVWWPDGPGAREDGPHVPRSPQC